MRKSCPKRLLLPLFALSLVTHIGAADINLRVVVINAWSGLTYSGTFSVGRFETTEESAFRYGLLVRQINALRPDLVFVNEANPLPKYARRLARDLDLSYVYAIRAGGVRLGPVGFPVNLREGDVILANENLRLEYLGNRDIIGGPSGNIGSFSFADPTHVLMARIIVGSSEAYLFATRWIDTESALPANLKRLADLYATGAISPDEYLRRVGEAVEGQSRRIEEARSTLEVIEEIAGSAPAILAGSLHSEPESAPISLLTEAGFADSFASATGEFTRDAERNMIMRRYFIADDEGASPARVDYLFIRGEGLRVVSRELAFDDPTFETHPSDHFGLVVDIAISDGS